MFGFGLEDIGDAVKNAGTAIGRFLDFGRFGRPGGLLNGCRFRRRGGRLHIFGGLFGDFLRCRLFGFGLEDIGDAVEDAGSAIGRFPDFGRFGRLGGLLNGCRFRRRGGRLYIFGGLLNGLRRRHLENALLGRFRCRGFRGLLSGRRFLSCFLLCLRFFDRRHHGGGLSITRIGIERKGRNNRFRHRHGSRPGRCRRWRRGRLNRRPCGRRRIDFVFLLPAPSQQIVGDREKALVDGNVDGGQPESIFRINVGALEKAALDGAQLVAANGLEHFAVNGRHFGRRRAQAERETDGDNEKTREYPRP